MKKTGFNNAVLNGIEKLILVYGDKTLMLDLTDGREVREISQAEARGLIRQTGVLLLSFGNFGPTAFQNMAQGYQIPLNHREERNIILPWFYSDNPRNVDEILMFWQSKEKGNVSQRILTREIL